MIDTYILFGDPAMSVRLQELDLWVQKQAAPAGPWLPGQAITYHLTYGNAGAVLATSVTLTDILPSQLTNPSWTSSDPRVQEVAGETYVWQLPDLPPGVTGTITLRAALRPGISSETAITNTATISGMDEPQNRLANNTSHATTPTVVPTGFDLEYLRSRREGGGFRIEWATRLERDIVGFNVYRTNNLALRGTLVNATMIPAEAPPGGGAIYSLFDPTPAKLETIYHRLEVIDVHGTSFFLGPVTSTMRGVYLPLIQKRR